MNSLRVLGALYVMSYEINKMTEYIEEHEFELNESKCLEFIKKFDEEYDYLKWAIKRGANDEN